MLWITCWLVKIRTTVKEGPFCRSVNVQLICLVLHFIYNNQYHIKQFIFYLSEPADKVIQLTPAFCTKLSTEKVNKIDFSDGDCS